MATESDESRRELTARRAYEIWERDGRPDAHELDHWLEAEEELDRTDDLDRGPGEPPISNLDRSLPPAQRAKARAKRHGGSDGLPKPPPDEHFFILADRVSVRILTEERPHGRGPILRAVETESLPEGHEEYFERDSAPQGRFPGNTRHAGMSIDERLPMQREQERRLITAIGRSIASFLQRHPQATWDFAAGAPLHRAILDELDPGMRTRMRRLLPKELSNQPVEALHEHFARVTPLSS